MTSFPRDNIVTMLGFNFSRWMTIAHVLAMSITIAIAQTVSPSNATEPDSAMLALRMSNTKGETTVYQGGYLLSLTPAAREPPNLGLAGYVHFANTTSQLDITSDDVVLISCDEGAYPGNIDAMDVFGTAGSRDASAIIFYSETSRWCNLQGYDGSYHWIYSLDGVDWVEGLFRDIGEPGEAGRRTSWLHIGFKEAIVYPDGNPVHAAMDEDGSWDSDEEDHDGDGNGFFAGPTPSTAVAMIILYSITGIITALFLTIVLTGAIRAHRHPERYGPRHVFGRPRQSRARGIARAMLDSIPIVKVGGRDQEQQKEGDVELADNNVNETNSATNENQRTTSANPQSKNIANVTASTSCTGSTNGETPGGIASAAATSNTNPFSLPDDKDEDNEQHCSICTENFETGQDQRVLPCDHRFHPECVDPWLLNVSGTCPLCRIDLRPAEERPEPQFDEHGNPTERPPGAEDEGNMPPPLGGEGQQIPRMGIRRSLAVGLLGRSRFEHTSPQERVAALREYRNEQQAQTRRQQGEGGGSEGIAGAEEGMRGRLGRVLGIRTRRTAARVNGGQGGAFTSQARDTTMNAGR